MEKRHFLTLMYKGTDYHGWQRQKDVPTIQGTIEGALARMHLPLLIYGSSRTDAGVHAQHQVAHIDLPPAIDPDALCHKLHTLLPSSIYIARITPVPQDAHARFDALGRTYRYQITTVRNPFLADTSDYCPFPLDINAMNEAATHLLGELDCKSFCKGHANVPHHRCHITTAAWHQKNTQLTFLIQANRFVHGMVRAIVGTLVEVGRGRLTPQDFYDIIQQRDRCAARSAAPPQGLFLTKVAYPPSLMNT